MRSHRVGRLGTVCTLLALIAANLSFAQVVAGESVLAGASVVEVADELEQLIVEGVSSNGGDLQTQHVHWVFAFSTGHFPVEPLRAQAARETAIELLRRFAVPGDKVSAYAFEMDVWQHPGMTANPISLPADGREAIEAVSRIFPLTAVAGSLGGHDTELSLANIVDQVGSVNDVVLVVFTNRAASVTTDPATRPLIGENSAQYQGFVAQMWRAPAVNRSGASVEGSYEIVRANGTRVQNSLDIVVAVGRSFAGEPLAVRRDEARVGYVSPPVADQAATVAETTVVETTPAATGVPGMVWVLVILSIAGVVFYLIRSGKLGLPSTDPNITVDGTVFSLPASKNGLVCRVVTKNYRGDPGEADSDRTLFLRSAPIGEEVVGRLVSTNGRLFWHDGEFKAMTLDGASVRAPVAISKGGELGLTGEVRERAGMPPRSMNVSISIEKGTKG